MVRIFTALSRNKNCLLAKQTVCKIQMDLSETAFGVVCFIHQYFCLITDELTEKTRTVVTEYQTALTFKSIF